MTTNSVVLYSRTNLDKISGFGAVRLLALPIERILRVLHVTCVTCNTRNANNTAHSKEQDDGPSL